MIGASSGDIRLEGSVEVNGEIVPPRDLLQVTRAVNYDDYADVIVDECAEGGDSVTALAGGGWIRFDDAALPAGLTFLELRAAATADVVWEVRLDGPEGPLAGTGEIKAGGKQQWQSFRCPLAAPEGRRSLCLKLSGAASISWFRIG